MPSRRGSNQMTFHLLKDATPLGVVYALKPRTTSHRGRSRDDQPQELEHSALLSLCIHHLRQQFVHFQDLLLQLPFFINHQNLIRIYLCLFCLFNTPIILPNIILLGDFTIHMDSPLNTLTKDFAPFLDSFSLHKYINFPTHTMGHRGVIMNILID